MSEKRTYDFTETLRDLDAGVFSEKLSRAVEEVAHSVVAHGDGGRSGKVTVEFTMKRIGESMQVQMSHKIASTRPTTRGKASEEDTTITALYYSPRAGLSIMPNDQVDAFGRNREENA